VGWGGGVREMRPGEGLEERHRQHRQRARNIVNNAAAETQACRDNTLLEKKGKERAGEADEEAVG